MRDKLMYVKLLLPFRMVVVVKYSRELLEILWMEASSHLRQEKVLGGPSLVAE